MIKNYNITEKSWFYQSSKNIKPKFTRFNFIGEIPDNKPDLVLGVVGSRKMSVYGEKVCEFIIKGFKGKNITIVSGLMYGVDIKAHRCAIENDLKTIGILGYGFDQLKTVEYANEVAKKIIAKNMGAIISEFDNNQTANKWTFPKRNRIVAAMCDAIVVIEASLDSGSLITVDFAMELGKEVFVIPGSIFSSLSEGKHKLLKEGATLIDSASDILEYYGVKELFNTNRVKMKDKVYELIEDEDDFEKILFKSKLSRHELSEILLDLELKAYISKDIIGRYQKCF